MGKKGSIQCPSIFFLTELFHNVYNVFFLFYSGDTTDEYNLTIYCIQIKVNCGQNPLEDFILSCIQLHYLTKVENRGQDRVPGWKACLLCVRLLVRKESAGWGIKENNNNSTKTLVSYYKSNISKQQLSINDNIWSGLVSGCRKQILVEGTVQSQKKTKVQDLEVINLQTNAYT